MWSEHRFLSFDGTPLFYRRFLPADAPQKGVLVIVHGMGEHGGRYRHVAEFLGGLGFECVLPDLRGFGKSGGRRACVRSFSDFHRDLAALHHFIWRTEKELPFFLLGHSFGGLVTSSYLAEANTLKVRGLVLTSPIFGIAIPVPFWRHGVGVLSSYIAPNYTQPTAVNPALLTHDPDMLEAYGKDDLIFHRISARLYRELTHKIAERREIAARVRTPVLLLQAGQDHIVSKKEALYFYDNLGSEDKESEVYPDLFHEILNETDRQKILTRIGKWLTARSS